MTFTTVLPWAIRRRLLAKILGYRLHRTSKLGLCWVFPRHLIMEEYASIGHLTVCKGLDTLHLKQHAMIGRGNWITATPKTSTTFFSNQCREPRLVLGEHAAITHRHIIDCTESLIIGGFTTIAGYRSQFLTHSIDLERCIQAAKPIEIGEYCFIGTGCIVLAGARLPDYSVLGAASLLRQQFSESYRLYAGVPSRCVNELSSDLLYFRRAEGIVY